MGRVKKQFPQISFHHRKEMSEKKKKEAKVLPPKDEMAAMSETELRTLVKEFGLKTQAKQKAGMLLALDKHRLEERKIMNKLLEEKAEKVAEVTQARETWHTTILKDMAFEAKQIKQAANGANGAPKPGQEKEKTTASSNVRDPSVRDASVRDASVSAMLAEMLSECDPVPTGVAPGAAAPKGTPDNAPPLKRVRTETRVESANETKVYIPQAVDLADMLASSDVLGQHRVWQIMQEVYGTPTRIIVPPKVVSFMGQGAGVLRSTLRDILETTWFGLAKGQRLALEAAVSEGRDQSDGSIIIEGQQHLYEPIEALAHALLKSEVATWRAEGASFRDLGHARRMEVLARYWGRSSVEEKHKPGRDGEHHNVEHRNRIAADACLRCGEKGHRVKDCKVAPTIRCERCKKKGHTVKACFRGK